MCGGRAGGGVYLQFTLQCPEQCPACLAQRPRLPDQSIKKPPKAGYMPALRLLLGEGGSAMDKLSAEPGNRVGQVCISTRSK